MITVHLVVVMGDLCAVMVAQDPSTTSASIRP